MSDGVEEYLDSRSGQIDSSGHFTLNAEASRRKLSQWQLPERRLYILKLIQWAVASSPNWIELKISRDSLELRHDGHQLGGEELQGLLNDPLNSSTRLRHFGVGLSGLLHLEPENVNLQSAGRSWDLLTFLDLGESTHPFTSISASPLPGQWLEKSHRLSRHLSENFGRLDVEGPLQRLIWDATGVPIIEASLVRHFCHLCSVPIWVNGRPINRPILGLPMSYEFQDRDSGLNLRAKASKGGRWLMFLLRREWSPQCLAAPRSGSFTKGNDYWIPVDREVLAEVAASGGPLGKANFEAGRVPKLRQKEEPYLACGAILFYTPEAPGVSTLLVQDGVIVEELFREAGFSGGTIAVDVSGLSTDLSSLSLRRNDEFVNKLNWLDGWAKYLAH